MNPYYEDDFVTLYHGDSREVTAWLEADVLVTDPPYGVRMKSRPGDAINAKAQTKNHVPDAIVGDLDTSARDAVLDSWGPRPAVVFGSWRIQRPSGVRALLIWHKEGAYSGPLNAAFFTNHEEIYIIGDGAWRKSAPIGHPTPKPVALMEALIDRCPSGTIADPFAGSGSTLLAAKSLGRRVVGVEIDERYCELAARRLSQDTLFGEAS